MVGHGFKRQLEMPTILYGLINWFGNHRSQNKWPNLYLRHQRRWQFVSGVKSSQHEYGNPRVGKKHRFNTGPPTLTLTEDSRWRNTARWVTGVLELLTECRWSSSNSLQPCRYLAHCADKRNTISKSNKLKRRPWIAKNEMLHMSFLSGRSVLIWTFSTQDCKNILFNLA